MTADQNKKTQRTFQCKDALWQKFEQMAKELECSVDYLVNDAMKQYARQRGYGAAAGSPSIPPPMAAPPPSSGPGPASSNLVAAPAAAPPVAPPKVAAPPPAPGKRPVAPPPVPHASGAGAPPPLPAPASALPAPTRRAPGPPPPPMPSGGARSMPPPPPPGRPVPPAPAPAPAAGKLTISYQGETFPVTKDRFIIGRGKQSSDLTIKDPNVSRQHAMIEFSEGRYYIVDMGSTNGVEFNGQRVQRKVISEGDSFRVCDHELKFSFG
jgi:hypothetical protein